MGHEFEIALILGILIIAAGVIVFNSPITAQASGNSQSLNSQGSWNHYRYYGACDYYDTYSCDQGYYDYQYQLLSSNVGKPVFVGTIQNLITKVEDLGSFFVSTDSINIVTSKQLFSGVVFGANSIKINGYIKDLTLDVFNSNYYGNLLVIADNGAEKKIVVDKQLPIGRYTIPIDNDGTVEIKAASSSWRIWAPTTYDVRVETYAYTVRPFEKEFTVESDVDAVELRLAFSSASGKIRVRVNDKIIMERDVRPEEILVLDKELLKEKNRLSIDAWDGSSFTGTAQVIKHSTKPETGKVDLDFFLNQSVYDKMSQGIPGKIVFDVIRVDKPGEIVVKIKNAEGNVAFAKVVEANPQTYVEFFTAGDVRPGVNKFTIESVDAVVVVGDVRIFVMDA